MLINLVMKKLWSRTSEIIRDFIYKHWLFYEKRPVFEKDLNYKLSTWEDYKYEQFATINEMVLDYVKEVDFWVSSDECYKYIASKFNMPEFLEYVKDYFDECELTIIGRESEEDHTEYLLELEKRVRLYLQTGNEEQYLYTGKQKTIDDDKL